MREDAREFYLQSSTLDFYLQFSQRRAQESFSTQKESLLVHHLNTVFDFSQSARRRIQPRCHSEKLPSFDA